MQREHLVSRFFAQEGRVDATKLRMPHLLTDRDWDALVSAAGWLYVIPMFIDDTPAITVPEMAQKARQAQAELKAEGTELGFVGVDYLQLMRGSARAGNREQEISEISRGLKQLAKDLKVPVVALSQLNRSVETRGEKSKRPQLSDLRESGAIEQDADNIVFIYRDDYYNKESPDRGVAELIVAKQRNGPSGTVRVKWNGWCVRFDDLHAGEGEDENG